MINWTGTKTQVILTGIIFSLCYLILISHSFGPQTSLDTYWHLQMGQDFLNDGLSPWVDHYSFTFAGNAISSVPILFQITIATLVSIFGEPTGLILFKASYITLLLSVIYLYFRQIKAPWYIIFIILPILIYFINMRLVIRPDIISNILAILCLTLYLRARDNFRTKELLPIFLLLLFWVNYHTPILGYIILTGLFLDRAVHKFLSNDTSYTWTQWFSWGTIILLIGFVNPTFDHVLFLIFTLSNEWYQHLSEYSPTYVAYSTDKMVYLSLIGTIAAAYLATVKKHYGLVFITVLLGYYAWSISRLLPAVSLINLCILALFLSQLNYQQLLQNLRPAFKPMIVILYMAIFLFSLTQTSKNTLARLGELNNWSSHLEQMSHNTEEKFPSQISSYLNSFHNGGNVLNTFNSGGYLIHALSHEYKIYIDGRTNILYPIEFYKHYLDILNDSETMESEIRTYNIDYAIFENTNRAHLHFIESDILGLNFASENYILFSRNKNIAFPLASKLLRFPMCWKNNYTEIALKEISLSKAMFSDKKYTIKFILNLLDEYLSNDNRKKYIQSLQVNNLSSDSIKRLAAYLALNETDFQQTKAIFKSIQEKNNNDLLMMSYALMMTEEYNTSKSVLAYYLDKKGGINKDSISEYDKIIIIKILVSIIEKSGSKDLASFDINKIKEDLGMNNSNYLQSFTDHLPYNSICNELFKF